MFRVSADFWYHYLEVLQLPGNDTWKSTNFRVYGYRYTEVGFRGKTLNILIVNSHKSIKNILIKINWPPYMQEHRIPVAWAGVVRQVTEQLKSWRVTWPGSWAGWHAASSPPPPPPAGQATQIGRRKIRKFLRHIFKICVLQKFYKILPNCKFNYFKFFLLLFC